MDAGVRAFPVRARRPDGRSGFSIPDLCDKSPGCPSARASPTIGGADQGAPGIADRAHGVAGRWRVPPLADPDELSWHGSGLRAATTDHAEYGWRIRYPRTG